MGRVNCCFVAQANAWRQRRRFEVAARHDQEGAPQIGPEHWNIGTLATCMFIGPLAWLDRRLRRGWPWRQGAAGLAPDQDLQKRCR